VITISRICGPQQLWKERMGKHRLLAVLLAMAALVWDTSL
jgi:hypothetical protein